MAKNDYIPDNDGDFLIWHDRFKTNVLAQAATVSLAAADTTPITTDNTDFHARIPTMNSANATFRQAMADKNTSHRGAELRARALARRIEAHPAYTVALGNLLGIEGPESTVNLATQQPELTATDQTGGHVELQFTKSVSDGVNIYSKRGDEANFSFLARDTASPYVDDRPLLVPGKPELREYKCVYVLNDAEIGLFSAELVVNCAP
jgi:hypothetical protein